MFITPTMPYTKEISEAISLFSAKRESAIKHCFEPELGLFIAESENVIERALDAGYQPHSALILSRLMDHPLLSRLGDIPVYVLEESTAKDLLEFKLTGGILVAMYRKEAPSYKDILKNKRRILVMENVVNPTNVGAMVRSAAALGMDAVLFSPSCADPLYRRAIRVSVGNIFLIPYAYIGEDEADWKANGVRLLQEEGFQTAAFALREDNVSVDDPILKQAKKLALIVGTEGDGLCEDTIQNADFVVKIPMSVGVDSLNVATAAAIGMWEIGRK